MMGGNTVIVDNNLPSYRVPMNNNDIEIYNGQPPQGNQMYNGAYNSNQNYNNGYTSNQGYNPNQVNGPTYEMGQPVFLSDNNHNQVYRN
jgi:hypothetical protein